MASKKNGAGAVKGQGYVPYVAKGFAPHNFNELQHRSDWGSSSHAPKGGARVIRGAIVTSEPRTWK